MLINQNEHEIHFYLGKVSYKYCPSNKKINMSIDIQGKLKKFMKKLFVIATFLVFSSVYAGGHLSAKDRIATLECAGLYYANSMIPQGTLELDKIVHSIASKKFLTTFLIKEGVKEDEVNSKLNNCDLEN